MWIERVAHRIDRWRRRPRFRAPASGIALAVLIGTALLVLLSRAPTAPGSPPQSSPPQTSPPLRLPDPPAQIPVAAPPPAPEPAGPAESGCPHGCAAPPPGCTIKGNISMRNGERIYHLPGQRYYDVTVISPEKGEAWFCTEAEARENGWRKSKV